MQDVPRKSGQLVAVRHGRSPTPCSWLDDSSSHANSQQAPMLYTATPRGVCGHSKRPLVAETGRQPYHVANKKTRFVEDRTATKRSIATNSITRHHLFPPQKLRTQTNCSWVVHDWATPHNTTTSHFRSDGLAEEIVIKGSCSKTGG